MIYRRCQCGKAEHFDSGMPPSDCMGCDECGTTYAGSKTEHKPRAPHDFVERKVIENGKETDESYCEKCYKKRKHLK